MTKIAGVVPDRVTEIDATVDPDPGTDVKGRENVIDLDENDLGPVIDLVVAILIKRTTTENVDVPKTQ
jgi:hypothetical protein